MSRDIRSGSDEEVGAEGGKGSYVKIEVVWFDTRQSTRYHKERRNRNENDREDEQYGRDGRGEEYRTNLRM